MVLISHDWNYLLSTMALPWDALSNNHVESNDHIVFCTLYFLFPFSFYKIKSNNSNNKNRDDLISR